MPPGAVPAARAWSLRGRIGVVLLLVCLAAAVMGGIGARAFDSPEAGFAGALAAGIAFGALAVGFAVSTVVTPTFAPLEHLVAATHRVRRGDFAERVPVATADEFGDLAIAFDDMQRGLQERESLHAAFGSYVDPALARRLLESGSSMFEGEELELTVLFADVRDFTGYSERVAPAEAVALLNRLCDVIVPILHEHGGHANHYRGDGLLAVFGAPNPLEGHADAAVAAAASSSRSSATR